MTSEERFIKIENALNSLAEHQVQHEERLARIETHLDRHIEFVGTSLAHVGTSLAHVVTSLTRLEEQVAQTSQQVNRTAAAQEVTEKRMQELIAKIDGIDGRVDKLEKKTT